MPQAPLHKKRKKTPSHLKHRLTTILMKTSAYLVLMSKCSLDRVSLLLKVSCLATTVRCMQLRQLKLWTLQNAAVAESGLARTQAMAMATPRDLAVAIR